MENIAQRAAIAKQNVAADEDNNNRRGVEGTDKRGNLDIDEIDEEINKDVETRKLVKLEDYEYQIQEINQFKSTNSAYKIFMEFIMLFKADTQERKEQGLPQQYFYKLDP